ncbi:MAG: hypothetical protein V7K15_14770 [Nostoc sp.]
MKHDSPGNNKGNLVAKTSLIRASETNTAAKLKNCSAFQLRRLKTYLGAQGNAMFTILVRLWRYSPLGLAKLGLFIGFIERWNSLSIARNG